MKKIEVTSKGVKKMLKGLSTTEAMGPDSIHPRVLKELSSELAGVLAHLFQQSIDIGTIPEDWKAANICPVQKND